MFVMQKTINKSFNLKGITLHGGKNSNIFVKPATANTGIIFRRIDIDVPYEKSLINAKYNNVTSS